MIKCGTILVPIPHAVVASRFDETGVHTVWGLHVHKCLADEHL